MNNLICLIAQRIKLVMLLCNRNCFIGRSGKDCTRLHMLLICLDKYSNHKLYRKYYFGNINNFWDMADMELYCLMRYY